MAERDTEAGLVLTDLREARIGAFYAMREGDPPAARMAYYTTLDSARQGAERVSEYARQLGLDTVQCDLVREFVRPPETKKLDPASLAAWCARDVLNIAGTIYQDHSFAEMPILADALEDAGCADETILAHCRAATPHIRGCWVLDLLLGK